MTRATFRAFTACNPYALGRLFRSIVESCEVLHPDCDSWMDAARIACENHGADFNPSRGVPDAALTIVRDCARVDARGWFVDVDFWAGEFFDALRADLADGGV